MSTCFSIFSSVQAVSARWGFFESNAALRYVAPVQRGEVYVASLESFTAGSIEFELNDDQSLRASVALMVRKWLLRSCIEAKQSVFEEKIIYHWKL